MREFSLALPAFSVRMELGDCVRHHWLERHGGFSASPGLMSNGGPRAPADTVGCAMGRTGCQVERFLAPVEPGNLLLLAYAGDVPVVSAPGCFRSPKPNVVDLLLPPLLARYRVSGPEVAGLGHGGLLQ